MVSDSKLHIGAPQFKAIRDGYGEGLLLAGEENSNVVVLCADLAESTRSHEFMAKYPDRYFELGVAEQNLVTVAAGLAVSGKIPFVSSYATFSPGRNYEQIRTTIAYNDANVKIAGAHAGVSVGPDGATHQATEDIAIMRVMPNMRVIVPCDAIEARKATLAAARLWGPVYLRLSREATLVLTTDDTPFTPGKAEVLVSVHKPEVTLIACGLMVGIALDAAKLLKKDVEVTVINCHTIKPLDAKTILREVKKSGAVVTLEEHQMVGGLGGAIAELLSSEFPVPIERLGLKDTFGESGKPRDLMEKYDLDVPAVLISVEKVLTRKSK